MACKRISTKVNGLDELRSYDIKMSMIFTEWSENILKLSSASMDYKDYEKKKNEQIPRVFVNPFSFIDVVISIAAVARSFFFIIV